MTQIFFYLDNPTVDGNFVISLAAADNVDEVGLALFALNRTAAGYLGFDDTGNSVSPALTVSEGDFVLGAYQRNNGSDTVSGGFTEVDFQAGNMAADAAYLIAPADGTYQPVYSGGSSALGAISSIASFAASTAGVTPYDIWAETNLPRTGGDLSADEDLDCVANGIEYVLGGSALSNDLGKLPTLQTDGANMTFTFVRDQDSVDGSTLASIEVGPDLSGWPDVYTVGADTAGSTPGVTVTDNLDGTDTVVLTVPRGAVEKKFARLSVRIGPGS
jgi:hypothetical protein